MKKLLVSWAALCGLAIGGIVTASTASAYPDCSNVTSSDWMNCQNYQNWINNYRPAPGTWGPNGSYTPCTGDAASIASGHCSAGGH